MNYKRSLFAMFGILTVAFALSSGEEITAGIDMDVASGGVFYTEPGFLSVPATTAKDYNVTHNGITFDLDGTSTSGMQNRYRSEPNYPLITDFAQWYSAGGIPELVTTISGLLPNTEHTVTFWTFNKGAGQTSHDFYEGAFLPENFLGTFTTSGAHNNLDNVVASVGWDLTSDKSGSIVVGVLPANNGERITLNGIAVLQIGEPPPPVGALISVR